MLTVNKLFPATMQVCCTSDEAVTLKTACIKESKPVMVAYLQMLAGYANM